LGKGRAPVFVEKENQDAEGISAQGSGQRKERLRRMLVGSTGRQAGESKPRWVLRARGRRDTEPEVVSNSTRRPSKIPQSAMAWKNQKYTHKGLS